MSLPPTTTYTKGWWDDCNILTPYYTWTEKGTVGGDLGTMFVENNDYFRISMTAIAGDASIWWEYPDSAGADNIGILTNTYKRIKFRYKCSNATIKAKIIAVYNVGAPQTVLAATNSETFAVGDVALTPNERLDHIQLYAEDAIGIVFYDFVMVYAGIYTFPNAGQLVEPFLSPSQTAKLPIPFRGGPILQGLGCEDYTHVHFVADLDVEDWGTPKGSIFYLLSHHQKTDLWQWMEFPEHGLAFKAYLESCSFPFRDGKLGVDAWFREFKLGGTPPDTDWSVTENYAERYGF